jgi:Flp pilus assembly protein TadG
MSVGRIGKRTRRRRETAAVELALVLPLILTMLVGLWEVSRVIECQQTLFNAACEAARQAATGQYANAQVQRIALNELRMGSNDTSGNMTKNATVTVVDLSRILDLDTSIKDFPPGFSGFREPFVQ